MLTLTIPGGRLTTAHSWSQEASTSPSHINFGDEIELIAESKRQLPDRDEAPCTIIPHAVSPVMVKAE
jgi:hypothetical protein